MGITQWALRSGTSPIRNLVESAAIDRADGRDEAKLQNASTIDHEDQDTAASVLSAESSSSLSDLRKEVSECRRCGLAKTRNLTVFGEGLEQADWLFIGEAPGQQEDRKGEPFVGRAGQLLNQMIRALGMNRADVYIANTLKCRPPNNRDPSPEELKACEPYLTAQIRLVQPKVIVALGRVSAQALLESTLPLGKLRGSVHQFGVDRTPLIATYHPAYLLRNPADKQKVWQDLLLAAQQIKA